MKIAVCVPAHLDTDALFTRSLARMLIHTVRERSDWDIEVFLERSPILPYSRNMLAARALAWGADRLLLLDADHTFPVETLIRLMSHGVPLVACNYLATRERSPVASIRHDDGRREFVWTTREKCDADLLEEVTFAGLGVCLVDVDALRGLDAPLFNVELDEKGGIANGEDAWFFAKLRAAGTKLLIDHRLSWFVWHISRRAEAFEAFQPPEAEGGQIADAVLPASGAQ